MSAYIFIMMSVIFIVSVYLLPQSFRTKLFDKYFQICLDETYNLDDLFPIKIQGRVLPKVDFLDIPYESLNIEINTKTIRGTIINNTLSLELIKPGDRRASVYLVKTHYINTVRPYINETVKNKKEYIDLVKISTKQRHNLERIACQTCRHRVQCQISFTKCNYEREPNDTILRKGIRINTNKNYELNK